MKTYENWVVIGAVEQRWITLPTLQEGILSQPLVISECQKVATNNPPNCGQTLQVARQQVGVLALTGAYRQGTGTCTKHQGAAGLSLDLLEWFVGGLQVSIPSVNLHAVYNLDNSSIS